MIGLAIMIVVVAMVGAFGLYRRRTDGRLRPQPSATSPLLSQLPLVRGDRATIVQFSSSTCATCGPSKRLLAEIADGQQGVVFNDVNAEEHLDLVRDLSIFRTPTVLILDGAGDVHLRASGTPRRDEVEAALADAGAVGRGR